MNTRQIQIGIIAVTVAILCIQLLRQLLKKPSLLTDYALLAELLFCFLRNLTILIEVSSPYVQCLQLVRTGYCFYILWIVFMDFVLLLRSQRFTRSPRVYLAITILLLAAFVTLNGFLTASIVQYNEPNESCFTLADFQTWSSYSYFTRLGLEVILIIPFVSTAIKSYFDTNESEKSKMWLRLSLVNTHVTVWLLVIEFALGRIAENPIFVPWLSTLFSIGNCIEGNLVMFLVEDTKKALKRTGTSAGCSKSDPRRIKSKTSRNQPMNNPSG
jgi:hypothetical protein